MGRRKKGYIEVNGSPYIKETKTIEVFRPLMNKEGKVGRSDVLMYLIRTLPEYDPRLKMIISLYTYETFKGLSTAQTIMFENLMKQFTTEGIFKWE